MKTCTKCGIEKPVEAFYKSKANTLRAECKECTNAKTKAWAKANPEKRKAIVNSWAKANPEKRQLSGKKYYAENTEKILASGVSYRASNPDKIKKWAKAYQEINNKKTAEWQKRNPDKVRIKSAKWREANPERDKANRLAWNEANPDAARIKCNNYRARKRENGGVLSKGIRLKLFKLQNGMCPCCREKLPKLARDQHLDHKMPITLGGANEDSNMQVLCATCNLSKGAKDPIDFMQSRGFLL